MIVGQFSVTHRGGHWFSPVTRSCDSRGGGAFQRGEGSPSLLRGERDLAGDQALFGQSTRAGGVLQAPIRDRTRPSAAVCEVQSSRDAFQPSRATS